MKKSFDAVEFQRKVREVLSQEYAANRETFFRKLREVQSQRGERKIHSGHQD
ncbi:MAG: hypothetical protein JW941_00870 [Candidatus Coatesbacteria bacterium]|nr:hypothetical protein [Candidatus Coatesbacteria bacterium]